MIQTPKSRTRVPDPLPALLPHQPAVGLRAAAALVCEKPNYDRPRGHPNQLALRHPNQRAPGHPNQSAPGQPVTMLITHLLNHVPALGQHPLLKC